MRDLTEEERKQLFQAIPGFDAGFLEVFPVDRYHSQQYILDLTVENIAGILRSWKGQSRKIIMTDMMDRVILETEGDNIIRCSNEEMTRQYIDYMPQRIDRASENYFSRHPSLAASISGKEEENGQ